MRINAVKQALASGQVQLGAGFGQFRSQDVARIFADAGFHWAFVDTEHGGLRLVTTIFFSEGPDSDLDCVPPPCARA